jgi:hypothetical protein
MLTTLLRDDTMTTTTKTLTIGQIAKLRAEAAAAGDQKQVRICDRALDGRTRAIAQCAAVIAAAQG